jgi:uncharacterized membrane protein
LAEKSGNFFTANAVPPNRWSGFRVPKTFASEAIWYAANRTMGIDLLLAGAVILACAIVTAKLIRHDRRLARRINFLGFVVSLVVALLHSFWTLDRL